MSLVVLPHVGALDLADRLSRTTHRAPDRTVAMDGQLEGIVNRIGRRIFPHRQFVQDDAAFHRKVILIQAGVSDHVGQRLDRHVEVRVTHARPVCRMLARGFCVRLAANAIESDSDIERRTLVRALEQKMLQEVRRPGRTRPLVARAHGHPQRDSRALRRRNPLGQNARPSSQDRAFNAGVAVLDRQARLVERQWLGGHTSPLASLDRD